MNILPTDALIIVDPQQDFVPGGKLAVAGGDEIMPGIVDLAKRFHEAGAVIVMTQDWHPAGHSSFASSHPGKQPFDTITMPYGEQVLWPDHCVQEDEGGDFVDAVLKAEDWASIVIRKGMNPEIDSYSAFYENDKKTSTGLSGYLLSRKVKRVFVVGLAYDYCVGYTALDAAPIFESVVIKSLSRAIAMPLPLAWSDGHPLTTVDTIEDAFEKEGVKVIDMIDDYIEQKPKPLPMSASEAFDMCIALCERMEAGADDLAQSDEEASGIKGAAFNLRVGFLAMKKAEEDAQNSH